MAGLRRFLLCADDAQHEQGFVQSRFDKLRASLVYTASTGLLLFVGATTLMFLAGAHDPDTFPSREGFRLSGIQMMAFGISACICVMLVVAGKVPQVGLVLGPTGFECLIVASLTTIMFLLVCTGKWYICKMVGRNPHIVFGENLPTSDSAILLVIDGLVTASHLALPVRWRIMIPFELLAVLLYAALVVLGSPEQEQAALNLVLLTGLIIAAALGMRVKELTDRSAFSQLLQEQVLRCHAEFRLEQLGGPAHAQRSSQETRSVDSFHTTHTGRIFEVESPADVPNQLANIVALGKREHWLLEPREVELLPDKVLGQGGFGFVVCGRLCGTPVAVKFALQKHGDAMLKRLSALTNELRVLRHLRHPNIVCIHGAVVDVQGQQVSLVMELVRGRTLEHFLRMAAPLPPEPSARYQVCVDVCRAFLYLHLRRPPIVHSDLKSANILVESDGDSVRTKLLDFGLARVLTRNTQPLGGTLRWMAPEVLHRDAAHLKCSADIFSLGMLLHFVSTGLHPRAGMSRQTLERALRTAEPVLLHWPSDSAFLRVCRPLAEACVQVDEQQRPTITVVHRLVLEWAREPDIHGLLEGTEVDLDEAEALEWREGLQRLQRLRSNRPAPQSVGNRADQARHSSAEVHALGGECSRELRGAARPPSDPLPTVQEEAPLALEGSSALPVASAVRRLLIPHLRPTKEATMLQTLENICLLWNYKVPRSSCCTYHARTRLLARLSQTLHSRPCRTEPIEEPAGQCSRCGILHDEPSLVCDMCAHAPDPASSRGARQRLEAL